MRSYFVYEKSYCITIVLYIFLFSKLTVLYADITHIGRYTRHNTLEY